MTEAPVNPEVENENLEEDDDDFVIGLTEAEKKMPFEDKEAFYSIKDSFNKGDNEGISFHRKKYKSLPLAEEDFTRLSKKGKKGSEIILGILNSALAFRMRNKATASLITTGKHPSITENKLAELRENKACVISAEEAENYVPGEREVSSLNGLIKQRDITLKQLVELKERKVEAFVLMNCLAKYREIDAQVKELTENQERERLEKLSKLDLD